MGAGFIGPEHPDFLQRELAHREEAQLMDKQLEHCIKQLTEMIANSDRGVLLDFDDIKRLEGDMKTILTGIEALKTEMSESRADIEGLKSELLALKDFLADKL